MVAQQHECIAKSGRMCLHGVRMSLSRFVNAFRRDANTNLGPMLRWIFDENELASFCLPWTLVPCFDGSSTRMNLPRFASGNSPKRALLHSSSSVVGWQPLLPCDSVHHEQAEIPYRPADEERSPLLLALAFGSQSGSRLYWKLISS